MSSLIALGQSFQTFDHLLSEARVYATAKGFEFRNQQECSFHLRANFCGEKNYTIEELEAEHSCTETVRPAEGCKRGLGAGGASGRTTKNSSSSSKRVCRRGSSPVEVNERSGSSESGRDEDGDDEDHDKAWCFCRCSSESYEEKMVECTTTAAASCFHWYHFECVGFSRNALDRKTSVPDENWECVLCKTLRDIGGTGQRAAEKHDEDHLQEQGNIETQHAGQRHDKEETESVFDLAVERLALRLSAEAPGSHQSPVTLQRNATNCAVATIKHDLCCQLSDDGKSIHQGAFSPPFLTLWRTQELPDSPPFPRWMHDFALERDDLVDLLGPPLADDDIVPPTACVIAWFSSFIPHLKNASNIMTRTRKGKACDNTKAAVHSNQEAEADMQLRWGLMATSEEPMCLMCGLSHDDLVEAVHIVPRGEYEVANCGKHTVLRRPVPVVDNISNGLLLCKNCRTLFEKFHWTARMDEQGIFRIALMTPNSRMPHRERDGQPLFPGDGRDAARSPLFLWLHAEAARQVHAPPQQLNADYGNGNWFASMAPAPQLGLMASTVASGSPAAASAATSSPSTTFRKCLMESSSELPARLAAWTILGQYGVIGCGGLEYL
ncbi:hypothetical protein HDU90_003203 [Geranomyces variabilis]|nr:hypothetical protein HDU90_003203 [Geranomyces variabilis]